MTIARGHPGPDRARFPGLANGFGYGFCIGTLAGCVAGVASVIVFIVVATILDSGGISEGVGGGLFVSFFALLIGAGIGLVLGSIAGATLGATRLERIAPVVAALTGAAVGSWMMFALFSQGDYGDRTLATASLVAAMVDGLIGLAAGLLFKRGIEDSRIRYSGARPVAAIPEELGDTAPTDEQFGSPTAVARELAWNGQSDASEPLRVDDPWSVQG